MKGIIEGLLFVTGDDGLSKEQLLELLDINEEELNKLITDLVNDYKDESRGIMLEYLGNKYKLITKKEHKKYYEKLFEDVTSEKLSNAALETLAVIAYNQPITRNKIEELRGVDSSHLVRRLLLKELIEEKGRSELPGRPMLYGTTNNFLDYFGLSSLSDLPDIEEIEILDEKNLFESKYQENE